MEIETQEEKMAEVIRIGILDMQVCVPQDWSDIQVLLFAEAENPCGTLNGWRVRKRGSEWLGDAPERAVCSLHPGRVHITLDV